MREGRRLRFAALALLASLVPWHATLAQRLRPRDVDALPSRAGDHRIAYGADSLQFGDLRLPNGPAPHPLVIVIHGGCWVSHFASLQNTAALSDALRDAGVATWNVEYRRLDHPGGGWPGTMADVAAAADYVRTPVKRFPLDSTRVIAIGHSAGGHLALWLGARGRLTSGSPLYTARPLKLNAVVALGGPGDLAEFTTYAANICGSPVIERLLGGTPAMVPDRYAQASPRALLPLGVRQLLIVGADDRVMPEAARNAYMEAAMKAGDSAEAIVVPGAHFEVIAPASTAWPTVRDAILRMLPVRP